VTPIAGALAFEQFSSRDDEKPRVRLHGNDEEGNIIPKTPEAAVLAVTTYLQSTQPPEGDPRAAIHRSALHGLGIVGAAITQKAAENVGPSTAARHVEGTPPGCEGSPRHPVVRHQETQPRSNQRRDQDGEGDMCSHLAQKKSTSHGPSERPARTRILTRSNSKMMKPSLAEQDASAIASSRPGCPGDSSSPAISPSTMGSRSRAYGWRTT
jgi:hypothetical protein